MPFFIGDFRFVDDDLSLFTGDILLVGGVVLGMSPAGQRGMNKGFNQMGRMSMMRR